MLYRKVIGLSQLKGIITMRMVVAMAKIEVMNFSHPYFLMMRYIIKGARAMLCGFVNKAMV
jgi:hypothetical protein